MDKKQLAQVKEAIQSLLGLKEAPEGDGLTGYTPEQLAEAMEKAKESFTAAKESRNLEAATLARDIVKASEAETTARAEAEAEVAAKFAELESDLAEEEAEEANAEEEVEEEVVAEESAEEIVAEEVIETPAVEAPAAEAPAEEKVAIAASAKPTKKPVLKSVGKPKPAKPLVRILASADLGDYSAGSALTVDDLANAFVAKARATQGSHAIGSQFKVASITPEIPADRMLDDRDPPEVTSEKINAVVEAAQRETYKTLRRMLTTRDPEEMDSLIAAGGLCAPTDVRYDIYDIGDVTDRPLQASLPSFFAKRGGIRYIDGATIPLMSDVQGALDRFTEAEDTSGARYPKPCLRVDCPTWVETTVESLTMCMEVGMWERLTFPENFRTWWHRAQVAFARNAETVLWDDLVSLSTAVSAGEGLGAVSDVLTQIDRAATQYRWRYRISPETPLRMWYPDWLDAILRTDVARQATGDGLGRYAVSDADLARWFAVRNIALTTVIDAQSPGGTSGDFQAAGALNPWPSTVDVILAEEGTFLELQMGQLDFGTEIRDFTLIRQNDVAAFYESFENVAKIGIESLAITLNICPDGSTAGPNSSFDPCTSGS